MDGTASKRQVKQVAKKPHDADEAKANTLMRPDGEKAACLRLAPGHEVLDVANTIGIIYTDPSC